VRRDRKPIEGWNWWTTAKTGVSAKPKPVPQPVKLVCYGELDPVFDPTPFSQDELREIYAWRKHGRPDVSSAKELWAFVELDAAAHYMTGKPR
jgi:hypothetical protein